MGQRRMFSNRIVGSARFLKMPISSQALYFHLGMNADDDGVVEAYQVIKCLGCTEDDLRVLVGKGFVKLLNEDLVAYISDWGENNTIRADRKIDSIYKDLLVSVIPDVKLIERKKTENGQPSDNQVTTIWQPSGNQVTTNGQPSDGISKDKLSKDKLSKDKLSKDKKERGHFVPPSVEDVQNRILEMGYIHVSAEGFVAFYSSKGWMVGKNKMSDWKQALAGWEARERTKQIEKSAVTPAPKTQFHQFEQRPSSDYDAFIKMVEGGNG